jgi:hypothetical protein
MDLVHIKSTNISKILLFLITGYTLISYIIIRYKSNKIFGLYNELKCYQKENFSSEQKMIFSLLPSLLTLIIGITLTVISMFVPYYCDKRLNDDVFKNISIPVTYKSHSVIMELYLHLWIVSIQLIYYKLNIKYFEIIEDFNNELKRTASEPVNDLIISTQRSVLMFTRFEYNLKNNINFIQYFIALLMITMNIMCICLLLTNSEFNLIYYQLIILYAVLMNAYFIWIQISVYFKKLVKHDLIRRLSEWQSFKQNDYLFIELEVLRVTVEHFNDDHYIHYESFL